jgi:hypothetical protein
MAQTEDSSQCKRRPVQCPKCSSYSASFVDIDPPCARCCCADCGTIYNYRMREIRNGNDNGSADEHGEEEDFRQRRRKAKADYRAHIQPALAPKLGFNTLFLDQAIAAGPSGIRKAQHAALKFAGNTTRKPSTISGKSRYSSNVGLTKVTVTIARARVLHLCGAPDFWQRSR